MKSNKVFVYCVEDYKYGLQAIFNSNRKAKNFIKVSPSVSGCSSIIQRWEVE